MPFYADLHVHSKHSRATSRDCDLEHLAWWARRKGISVVATGDFTHPAWWAEIEAKLVPAEPGLYRLRPEIEAELARTLPAACRGPVRFLLEVEISTIYKKGERTRKVHHLLYAAHRETAGRIRERLGRIGNIASDGRPILGLDSRHLLEITLEAGDDAYLVPAHIWTPWFAALGSKSGFDSIEECYGDLAGHIFAVETGLSSDPPMNWRVSSLDRFTLVSNSDAHSPPMLGREACAFDTELDYFALRRALETGEGYGGTVEFFPEEGKYHLDGHRACGVRLEPAETRRREGLCPACAKPLTVGVMHRVEALADRPEGGEAGRDASPYRSLVPLAEIVSELRGVGPRSKQVVGAVSSLVERLGPELAILGEVPVEEVQQAGEPLLAEALQRLRAGRVQRQGGYDGEYGVIRLFEAGELQERVMVPALFASIGEGGVGGSPGGAVEPGPAIHRRADSLAMPRRADAPAPSPSQLLLLPSSPLDSLDPEQREAAGAGEGPLLIVAGPGTGKTRTLTHRLAWLIGEQGVPAASCLALTFSRRAARELAERLEVLLPEAAGEVAVSTFHALGLSLLREQHAEVGLERGFRLLDGGEATELVQELFALSPSQAARRLEELAPLRREEGGAGGPVASCELAEQARRYEEALCLRGQVDFDGLLLAPVRLLDERPDLAALYRRRWPWICVDEYQDIDPTQYRLLRLLAPAGANLCAIGDPDQAIYGFRGSDVSFFLRFREDYPGARTVQLGRNYRSSPAIVRAALAAVRPASLVPERRLAATGREGAERITVHRAATAAAEAEWVVESIERLLGGTSYFSLDSGRVGAGEGEELSFGDLAILFRTRAQAEALEEALHRSGIPFQRRSHEPLAAHPGVQGLAAALRHGRRPGSVAGQLAAAAGEGGGAAEAEAEAVELLAPLAARHGDDLDGFLAALALGAEVDAWDPRAERVSLLTLHAAKGLEWPVVFLVGCEEGLLPLYWGDGEPEAEALAEERRLFFVGLTRARSHLHLSWAARRHLAGQLCDRRPSRFLADLPTELLRREEGKARKQAGEGEAWQMKLF